MKITFGPASSSGDLYPCYCFWTTVNARGACCCQAECQHKVVIRESLCAISGLLSEVTLSLSAVTSRILLITPYTLVVEYCFNTPIVQFGQCIDRFADAHDTRRDG